jgi:hypothetical protein
VSGGILRIPSGTRLRYEALIGTGGIGSGSFFLLDGDHTLGREESRKEYAARARDDCFHVHPYLHKMQNQNGQ